MVEVMNNDWMPVKSGNYPNDKEIVQVTLKESWTEELTCLQFAYRLNGRWLSDDGKYVDEIAEDRVVAWRNCIPYGSNKVPTI